MTLEEARQHLGTTVQADGSLLDMHVFTRWSQGDSVELDGSFSLSDLEAIVVYIKSVGEAAD